MLQSAELIGPVLKGLQKAFTSIRVKWLHPLIHQCKENTNQSIITSTIIAQFYVEKYLFQVAERFCFVSFNFTAEHNTKKRVRMNTFSRSY